MKLWSSEKEISSIAADFSGLRILYLTDRNDAPFRYRCVHACEQLRESGAISNIKHVDSANLLDEIPCYSLVVLFRLEWSSRIEEIIRTAAGAGIPVAFDIDDVIFNPVIEAQMPFLKHFPESSLKGYRSQFSNLRKTLLACDFCIVSTETIAAFAASEGIPALIHPNLLSRTYIKLSKLIYPLHSMLQHKPCIGYMSGSNTHDGDLGSIAAPLIHVLKERNDLFLLICGHIGGLPSSLKSFSKRILHIPYQDYRVYPWLMARCRALLAPIEIVNDFSNAKSALKVFEAGVFGVPVVATPTDEYRKAIEHGRTGFLASDSGEWADAIFKLSDSETSLKLGAAARRTALKKYSPDAFHDVLAEKLVKRSVSARGKTPRLESFENKSSVISSMERSAKMIGASMLMAIHPPWKPSFPKSGNGPFSRNSEPDETVSKFTNLIEAAEHRGNRLYLDGRLFGVILADCNKPLSMDCCSGVESDGISGKPGFMYRAINNDPWFQIEPFTSIHENHHYLIIKMIADVAGGHSFAQFFWTSRSENKFSEKNSLRFEILADGTAHVYLIDLLGDDDVLFLNTSESPVFRFDPMDRPGYCGIDLMAFIVRFP